jgi:methionine-rich copper-binding protein CopC
MIDRAKRRAAYVLFGLLGLVLITPAIAWAHAELTRSEPAAHSMLATLPSVIRLWFSEEPDVAMTQLVLNRPSGQACSRRDSAGGTDSNFRSGAAGKLHDRVAHGGGR